MPRSSIAGILVAFLVALGASFWWWHGEVAQDKGQGIGEAAGTNTASTTPDMVDRKPSPKVSAGQRYADSAYGFSFAVPDGFTARALGSDGSGTKSVVVENGKGDGLQVLVSPFDENLSALTEARIRQDLPDMRIDSPQTVTIASNVTGLAFSSDNPAWGGASAELWFVYEGNLYQLATYQKNALLLDSLWKTWKW